MICRTISITLACTLFFNTGCNRGNAPEQGLELPGKVIEIEGVLEKGAGYDVILEEMAAREFIPVDTATCNEQGEFHISFKSGRVAFYVLRTGSSGYITLLMEPGEKIEYKGSYGQPDPYTVKGSEGSELLMVLAQEHKRTLEALGLITRKNMELQATSGYAQLKEDLDRQFDSITTVFHDYSLDFIDRNQESPAILIALYNLYGQGLPVFHPEGDLEVYRFVDSVLTPAYGDLEVVRLLHAQVLGAQLPEDHDAQVRGPEIGEIAPDFVSSRPDGDRMALSDLKGKTVLLSFWAGWSKLSREENRYLKEAWTRHGTQPFRILQVSFDEDAAVWLRAIEEDGLKWDHVSDLRRWETVVADLYGVEKIPSNFLVDPEGRIIGRDLFANELTEYLENLYGKD